MKLRLITIPSEDEKPKCFGFWGFFFEDGSNHT